jgi:septum formation protein
MEIILASKSPRRQELVKHLDIPFRLALYEVDESFDDTLFPNLIAERLAIKKASFYPEPIKENEVLLTADTIVWVNQKVLNKPQDKNEAMEMLGEICGKKHSVFTGVCLKSANKEVSFAEQTEVTCSSISTNEMEYYITKHQPFDKAGSYGIQDWFGLTVVEKIDGCYYNVMGLPVNKIYATLKKEFGLLLTLLFLSFGALAQTETIISGILPDKAGQAMLQYFSNPYSNNPDNTNFIIAADGSFRERIKIAEGQMLVFVNAVDYFKVYVKPGDSLFFRVDPKQPKTLLVTGNGGKEAQFGYNYFQYFKSSTEANDFQKQIGQQLTNKSPEGFKSWADSIIKVKLTYLEKYGKDLSPSTKNQLQAEYIFEYQNLKLSYPQYYQSKKKSNPGLPELDSAYFNFLKGIDLNQSKFMESLQYRTFQKLYLIKAISALGRRMEMEEIWFLCEQYFKGEILSKLRLNIWSDIVFNGSNEDASKLYKLAQKDCAGTPGFKYIEEGYLDKMPFLPGSKAFPFVMKDDQGKVISLESLKGKVVYLDFWASWCRPCLGEIPAGEELKKRFEGKDVVFINISIDEGEQNWVAAKAKYNINGIHALSNNRNHPEVQKKYKVQSIPSYFLIDKEGNFISAPAPRPSNPSIYQLIEDALKK